MPKSIYRESVPPAQVVAGNAAGLFRAKVAHAGVPTANGRVYPVEQWRSVIASLGPRLAQGKLIGGLDHPAGLGSLRDSVLIWRSLSLEADGAVIGAFSIVPDHQLGRDLLAQITAGMAIGFSTVAVGESERDPLGHDRLVRFELLRIDAVDQPAVSDAYLHLEHKPNPMPEPATLDSATLTDPLELVAQARQAIDAIASRLAHNPSGSDDAHQLARRLATEKQRGDEAQRRLDCAAAIRAGLRQHRYASQLETLLESLALKPATRPADIGRCIADRSAEYDKLLSSRGDSATGIPASTQPPADGPLASVVELTSQL